MCRPDFFRMLFRDEHHAVTGRPAVNSRQMFRQVLSPHRRFFVLVKEDSDIAVLEMFRNLANVLALFSSERQDDFRMPVRAGQPCRQFHGPCIGTYLKCAFPPEALSRQVQANRSK